MLSQLTLRFPKTLIARLKNRAATENTSVNALAERLVETGLEDSAAGEEYLRLVTDPDEALRSLYRRLILGQTFGAPAYTRDTLRFLLGLAHQGYSRGQGQLVSMPRLQVLLEVTAELLAWQVDNGQPVDSHYLKGTFGLAGEDWPAEFARFTAQLTPGVTQDYAEQLLRPLVSGAFTLHAVPDAVLASVFTQHRLKTLFPLCLYARDWDFETVRRFADQVRPVIPAAREMFEAGTVRFEVSISGQEPGTRAGSWYDTPRLYLVLHGRDMILPFGLETFSELLRTLTVYQAYPDALRQGWHGRQVMFSPRETAAGEVMIGLETLRAWLPEHGFAQLVTELVSRFSHGELARTLDSLHCLYGDL